MYSELNFIASQVIKVHVSYLLFAELLSFDRVLYLLCVQDIVFIQIHRDVPERHLLRDQELCNAFFGLLEDFLHFFVH
jgi:hypothetical protein